MDLRDQLQLTLGGNYTLERELGGGGMSRVFVAQETALGRTVVIKVISPGLAEGVSAERFAREVKLAARLQQANIVPVLTVGESGGLPYYTMPFVRGESLRTRLASGTLPIADAMSILRDVARALAYAHAEGVVHRDIKPENILLSGGAAVVTDFGIAKALSASRTEDGSSSDASGTLTQAGSTIGTPAYMAPEQAVGAAVDHRADLYAWGVVAYELLAGAHPFSGRSGTAQLIAAHIAEVPTPLGAKSPDVPRAVADLVTQCLEKDPSRRPQNADALVAGLSAIVTPSGKRPSSSASRARAVPGRRPLVIGIVGIAALAVALFVWRGHHATDASRTVVVIPFDNLGAADDAYFADGVTEEIGSQLARIPGIQVIARASVLRFRGSGKTPVEIARELGAEYALSGTVRWARAAGGGSANGETMVRIVPALTRVSTGAQIWGEPFQQKLTDVFSVQADVAERVASALSITLGSAERAALRRPDSRDAEARDAQLLGRQLLHQRGLDNLRRAVAEFRRAISRDSQYARAWAGYSEAYGYLPTYSDSTVTFAQANAESERAAHRAIALDSLLADAHLALATALEHDFRFNAGLSAAEHAIALDPGSALASKERGTILMALGRVTEAGVALRRAVELDPLVPVNHVELATWYGASGQLDSARREVDRAIELDPSNTFWQFPLQLNAGWQGRVDDAIAACTKFTGRAATCRDLWTGVLVPANRARGLSVLDSLGRTPLLPMVISLDIQAGLYAKLAVPDSAFVRLRRAIDERSPYFYSTVNSSWFASLHSDPRWDAIVGELRRR
jgi:eukaryotic-like serine/threonine-protein kinase